MVDNIKHHQNTTRLIAIHSAFSAATFKGESWSGIWLALLFCVASCDSHTTPDFQRLAPADVSAVAAQKTVRFALASAVINLDPRYATDAASSRVIRLLYRPLVDFDAHNQARADCADWEKLKPRWYRFRLLDSCGAFHNGMAITSDDVIATYRSILDPASASPFKQRLDIIRHIYRVDDKRLDFELRQDDPLFPAYLDIGILPQALIRQGHLFSQAPIGNGEFKLLRFDAPGNLLLQRRRDGLRVQFLHVPDPTVRMLMLLRNEIDLCQNDLTPELVNYARKQAALTVLQGKGSNFSYLGFNLKDPSLADIRVRRAIAMSIDRDDIIKHVFYGAAEKASSVLANDHWVFDRSFTTPTFDPKKARQLLSQAGYKDKILHISYKTSKDPFRIRLATVIQSQLHAVGIDMDIQSLDWGSFFADVKAGRFQIYSLSWVGIRTPDIYRQIFHSQSLAPKGANRGYFSNTTVDRLLDDAISSDDLSQIRHDYSEVQQIVLQQLPYVPLWYEDHIAISNRHLSGYHLNRSGNYDSLSQVSWH